MGKRKNEPPTLMPRHKKPHFSLYADECIPYQAVTYLRSLGLSIKHVVDLKLIARSDDFHFKNSKKLGRVLLSFDGDFKKIDVIDLKNHPGIVLISAGEKTPIHVQRILLKFIKNVDEDYVKGSLLIVSFDKIIRFRKGQKDQKKI